jgi:antitoxin component YwqK of YwqJK toxin-antitoxin module
MDFIDDYTMGKTLSHNKEFMNFLDRFETKSNISVFVQMPKIYSHLYYYSKADKKKGIHDNKETIFSFTRLGMQLISDNKMFKTKLVAEFDESAAFNSDLENIESAAEELFLNTIDSGGYKIDLNKVKTPKTGPAKIYYEDSTTIRAEGRVIDGKPDGLWRSYFEDGKIMYTMTYKEGMANGLAMFYFDDDKQTTRVELTFDDDKIVGTYREFYENGNRKAMLIFKDGVPDGDAEFYYDSGVIKIEGQYKDGMKNGKWKHFTETGEMINKEKWKKKSNE